MSVRKTAGLVICLLCVPVIQSCSGILTTTGTAATTIVRQDRRTTGAYIDDELIELKVQVEIGREERLWRQMHINATSFNGLVLLTGEAPGQSLRDHVTRIARNISGVRGVQNEVALEAPSSLLRRANDTVVTGKVKLALLRDAELNAVQVKVVTERSIVYLMGLLRRDEADRAVEIARRVAGVQRVVKVMEYIE